MGKDSRSKCSINWTVLEAAIEEDPNSRCQSDRAFAQGAERGWVTARDYYIMSELSQAERSARTPGRRLHDLLEGSEISDGSRYYDRMNPAVVASWERLAGEIDKGMEGLGLRLNDAERDREAGRGRERALEAALSRLLNASRDIMPYEKKGPVNELIEAETHAVEVLSASQPERCGESQPDHGLGEPSDARITVGLKRIGPTGGQVHRCMAPRISDDRELEAVNEAYRVMLDETKLPDDFDAAQAMNVVLEGESNG